MITLRNYQHQAVADLRESYRSGHKRPLLVVLPSAMRYDHQSAASSGQRKAALRLPAAPLSSEINLAEKIMTKRICIIPFCGKPHDSNGYCGMHAQRVRRYGDPHYVTPEDKRVMLLRASNQQSKPASDKSYIKFYGRHEHRVVAEQMLGRPLKKGEIVHHIDGDRHNNAPENLSVMTQSEHIKANYAEMMKARKDRHGY